MLPSQLPANCRTADGEAANLRGVLGRLLQEFCFHSIHVRGDPEAFAVLRFEAHVFLVVHEC